MINNKTEKKKHTQGEKKKKKRKKERKKGWGVGVNYTNNENFLESDKIKFGVRVMFRDPPFLAFTSRLRKNLYPRKNYISVE